jgi:hypothetical protein
MKLQYTYEIIKVDQAARNMEVIYSSEGRQTMHIGTRLPFENETLEAVIQMYAPVALWIEMEMAVVAPEVGQTGSIVVSDEPEEVTAPALTSGEIPVEIL